MQQTDQLVLEFLTRGAEKLQRDMQLAANSIGRVEDASDNMHLKLGKTLALGGGGAAAAALGLIGRSALRSASNVEAQIATLEALTKSGDKARQTFAFMDKQSGQSLFTRNELVEAGQLLTAYRLEVEKYLPLADDLAAAFKSQGASAQDVARVFGRLSSGDFGEAFERLRDFGISRKDLELKGLEFDKGGAFQGSVDQAMRAVEEIVTERFSGLSKKVAGTTLAGATSNFEDAADRLNNAVGKLVLPEATEFVKGLSRGAEVLQEFAEANPELAKGAIKLTGFTVAAGAVGIGLTTLKRKGDDVIGMFGGLSKSKQGAAAAADLLTKATRADAAAEAAKALVAGQEASAIGAAADAADLATGAKSKLAKTTAAGSTVATTAAQKALNLSKATAQYSKASDVAEKASGRLSKAQATRQKVAARLAKTEEAIAKAAASKKPVDPDKAFKLGARKLALENRLSRVDTAIDAAKGALDAANAQKRLAAETAKTAAEAAKATPKLSAMARARALMAKPIHAPQIASKIPQLAKPFIDPITKEAIDPTNWNAAKRVAAGGANTTNAAMRAAQTPNLAKIPALGKIFIGSGAQITIGGAAAAGIGGLLTGVNSAQNYEALGYEKGDAYMRGAATGIGAAGAAMFLPGGAVAVALAEGLGFLLNNLFTDPLERRTNEGTGLPEDLKKKFDVTTPEGEMNAQFEYAKRKSDEATARSRNPFAVAYDRATENFSGVNLQKELELEGQTALAQANAKRRQIARAPMEREVAMRDENLQKFFDQQYPKNRRVLNPQIGVPKPIEGVSASEARKDYPDYFAKQDAARKEEMLSQPGYQEGRQQAVQVREVGRKETNYRNDTSTIQIVQEVRVPQREADKRAREDRYVSLTADPDYASM